MDEVAQTSKRVRAGMEKRRVLREAEETTDGEAGLPAAHPSVCLGNQSSWQTIFGTIVLEGFLLACG